MFQKIFIINLSLHIVTIVALGNATYHHQTGSNQCAGTNLRPHNDTPRHYRLCQDFKLVCRCPIMYYMCLKIKLQCQSVKLDNWRRLCILPVLFAHLRICYLHTGILPLPQESRSSTQLTKFS